MQKLKESFQKFMYGRYGTDPYNNFLLTVGFILYLLSMFFGLIFLILGDALFVYVLFRMMSKNRVKRSMENQKYYAIRTTFQHYSKSLVLNIKDKQHKYYVCPQCHRLVRVPRGHGKIDITCPTCRKVFSRKS